MKMIQTKKLRKCVKTIYSNPLPTHIKYHNWDHTKQVEEAGINIAKGETLQDYEAIMKVSGALFLHFAACGEH